MLLEFVKGSEMVRRCRPAEFFAGSEMKDLPSEAAVAEEAVDVVVAGEAPMSELLPMENRMFRAPFRVKGVRILDEGRIPGIEGDGGELFGHLRAGERRSVSRIPVAGAMRRVARPWERSHHARE